MNYITLTILPDRQAVAKFRADDLEKRLREGTLRTFIPNTGSTPIPMWDMVAERQLDLSGLTLLMLDELLSTSAYSAENSKSYQSWIREHIGMLSKTGIRLYKLDGNLMTCKAIDEKLRTDGVKQEGAVIKISKDSELAAIARFCEQYSHTLYMMKPELASLGVGPMPYPHSALNCDYTPADARTGLRIIDGATRQKLAEEFGGLDNVPRYGISIGPFELVHYVREIWITAAGEAYTAPVDKALFTATYPDSDKHSSLGYLLTGKAKHDRNINIALDLDAAQILIEKIEILVKQYESAGLSFTISNRA